MICYSGAIIPGYAMPPKKRHRPATTRQATSETKAKMTTTAQQNHLVALFKAATIIPVLTIERIQDAVPLARALVAGGVRTLEVTMRTPSRSRRRGR